MACRKLSTGHYSVEYNLSEFSAVSLVVAIYTIIYVKILKKPTWIFPSKIQTTGRYSSAQYILTAAYWRKLLNALDIPSFSKKKKNTFFEAIQDKTKRLSLMFQI